MSCEWESDVECFSSGVSPPDNSQLINSFGVDRGEAALARPVRPVQCGDALVAGVAVGVLHQPFYVRLENAFQSSFGYMLKMAWPAKTGGAVSVSRRILSPGSWACGSCGGRAECSGGSSCEETSVFIHGLVWFLGTLVPVIGLVRWGSSRWPTRYTYVPLIGLFIVIAWGGHELARRWQLRFGVLAPWRSCSFWPASR